MKYLGDYASGSTLYFTFSTHKADGTPITLAGTPSLAIYKADGTSQSTTGITLTVDFDSVTGLHSVKIECTDAFYAVGNDYSVVIAAGTVDSVSVVGYTIATFSIENRNIKANVTAISDDTTAADNCELMFDGTGYAGGTTKLVTEVNTKTGFALTSDYDPAKTAATQTSVNTIDGIVDDILVDTGTTLDTLIKDLPTNSEFEARTIPSANYALNSTVAKAATALSNAIWTDAKAGYITGNVALEATLTAIDALIDAIKAKTDSLTFTTPDKVDASASISLSAGDIEDIADGVIAGISGGGSTLYSDTVTSDGVLQVGAKIAVYHAITDADPFTVVYTDSTGKFKVYLDPGTYPIIVTSEGDQQKIDSITVT